jgi:hypothetical protein
MLLLAALLIRIEEGLKPVDVVRHAPTKQEAAYHNFICQREEEAFDVLGATKGRRTTVQNSDPSLSHFGCYRCPLSSSSHPTSKRRVMAAALLLSSAPLPFSAV